MCQGTCLGPTLTSACLPILTGLFVACCPPVGLDCSDKEMKTMIARLYHSLYGVVQVAINQVKPLPRRHRLGRNE